MAARGGGRSAAESSAVAPINWASEGPNMLRADSSGERVAAYTNVPRASPVTVVAATCTEEVKKSGVNSGALTSSR